MPLPGNISADFMIAQVFCGVNVQTRQKSSDFIHILHKPQSLIIVVQEHGLDGNDLVVFFLLHLYIRVQGLQAGFDRFQRFGHGDGAALFNSQLWR